MKRSVGRLAGLAMMMWALPASAQTTGPAVNAWYGGVFVGGSAVENAGPLVGIEAGIRTTRNLDLIAEGGWAKDVVTRRRLESTAPLVEYLQTRTGKTASASVEAPVWFGAAGLRWVFEREGALRPYIMGTVGYASVEYKPTFIVDGTDVTSSLADLGVTLGQDLHGREKRVTFGGGAGLLYVRGGWYLDASLRLTSIQTKGQATNVGRAAVGLGFRF